MSSEAPIQTSEQIVESLVDKALNWQKRGIEREVLIYSQVFRDSPRLATRFKVLGLSTDFDLMNIVDEELEIDHDAVAEYSSGCNQFDAPRYWQWISPSRKHPRLFTIQEEASIGIHVVASRADILVSRTDLTQFSNWSAFFDQVILEGV